MVSEGFLSILTKKRTVSVESTLPRGLNVALFWIVYCNPQEEAGHNQKGTSFEPLGRFLLTRNGKTLPPTWCFSSLWIFFFLGGGGRYPGFPAMLNIAIPRCCGSHPQQEGTQEALVVFHG